MASMTTLLSSLIAPEMYAAISRLTKVSKKCLKLRRLVKRVMHKALILLPPSRNLNPVRTEH